MKEDLPEKAESSSPAPVAGSLRRGLLIGAGLGAAALGSGVAWWTLGRSPAGAIAPVDGFWSLHWDRPGGGTVRMVSFIGRPVVINFWATWCPPCVEELPLLNRFYQQQKSKGWQVLALAIDKPASVDKFLKVLPLDFTVALAGLSGTELARSLGNLTGGLPFTVVLGSDGRVAQRKMGRVFEEDLQVWAAVQ